MSDTSDRDKKTGRTRSVPQAAQIAEASREPVVSIRLWGTHQAIDIPPHDGVWLVGRAANAHLRVDNAAVSARHCEIVREGGRLFFRDANSRGGCLHDGIPFKEKDIEPNMVVELGPSGVRLIATTPHGLELRRTLQRFLGYAEQFQPHVDEAVRAAARRRHLVIMAPDGGQPERLARVIHDAWLKVVRPFVEVDHVSGDRQKQRRVVHEAAYGTLVVPAVGLPANPANVLNATRPEEDDVRLVIVAGADVVPTSLLAPPFVAVASFVRIPRLVDRKDELGLLIAELQRDIAPRIGAEAISIAAELPVLLQHTWPNNLDELEAVITYVLAYRLHGSQRAAAKALGVKKSTLNDRLLGAGLTLR
jgi:FHA domain